MHFISKRETLQISAIAVILMVFHHINMRTAWAQDISIDNYWGSIGFIITRNLAMFGKICVCIFAFMSGYALAINPEKFRTYSQTLKRIVNFLKTYWLFVVLFLLFGYLTDDKLPSKGILIGNLVGLDTGITEYVNVCHAWYVFYYIFFLLTAPLLVKTLVIPPHILNKLKKDVFICIVVVLCMSIIMVGGNHLPYLGMASMLYPWFGSILGVVVAKYRVFDKAYKKSEHIPTIVILMICGLLVLQRNMMYDYYTPYLISGVDGLFQELFNSMSWILGEGIFASLFIYFLAILLKRISKQWIVGTLEFVGGLSMYIWFTHGIFFTGKKLLQPMIYWSHEPALSFICCFFCSLIISLVVKYMMESVKLIYEGSSRSKYIQNQRDNREYA